MFLLFEFRKILISTSPIMVLDLDEIARLIRGEVKTTSPKKPNPSSDSAALAKVFKIKLMVELEKLFWWNK